MTSLPRQCLVAPAIERHALDDPLRVLAERLDVSWAGQPWAGKRVAVAIGSRGIDRIGEVARVVVGWLMAHDADVFLMPAMGSHGGATPQGQRELLEGYGVTEVAMGAPIDASMAVTEIGETSSGVHVVVSSAALAADVVVLVNRIKPHTDFDSPIVGSGLLKMAAIGLGKQEGAVRNHFAAARVGHERVILEASELVLGRLSRVHGVALLEDGGHQLARIEVLDGAEFRAHEPALLEQARAWMPMLPVPEVDVLIVDAIGKNISGTGMDTNIVGRGVDLRPRQNRSSDVRAIYLRGLTPESHGNAIGIGLADVVSSRLVREMDPVSTYTNAVSAMTPAPARISMHFDTDRECLRAALRMSGADVDRPRIARIRHTLALDRVVLSEACLPAMRAGVELLVSPTEWQFDASGNLDAATDRLATSRA